MALGLSVHIGLNEVDKTKYIGKYKTLRNAENDCEYYYQLAISNGFTAVKLAGKEATSENLLEHLEEMATKLNADDLLFISYSGHGTRVKDLNNDEEDGYDEALVLYDRLFIDDEFQLCWGKFKKGVRIFMITDSCFNGSVSRLIEDQGDVSDAIWPDILLRGVDTSITNIDFYNNLSMYKEIKSESDKKSVIAFCSIIHIGACQDNQLAEDGAVTDKNGRFTSAVREIYNDGNFNGSYKRLFELVKQEMPPWQTPSWDTEAGLKDEEFEKSAFLQFR
ncbi:MAG: caspase family protein [Bacteroidota bacterium]